VSFPQKPEEKRRQTNLLFGRMKDKMRNEMVSVYENLYNLRKPFSNSKIASSETYLKVDIYGVGKAMTRSCAVAKSVKVKESKLRFLEGMEKGMLLET